jgi:Rrf2 family protein
VRVSARADYAVRAAAELATAAPGAVLTGEEIARRQGIPYRFLVQILRELAHAGLVESRRGPEGGFLLARPPGEVTVADVIRAVDGPLAAVQGRAPEAVRYAGAAAALDEVWIASRAALRAVLERVSLADLAAGELPDDVRRLAAEPEARTRR